MTERYTLPAETTTVTLTAEISSDGVTIKYGGTHYDEYLGAGLERLTSVTLVVTASDGVTKLDGTLTSKQDGTTKSFDTSAATVISTTVHSSDTPGEQKSWGFKVQTETGVMSPDPTLILQTKSGGRR